MSEYFGSRILRIAKSDPDINDYDGFFSYMSDKVILSGRSEVEPNGKEEPKGFAPRVYRDGNYSYVFNELDIRGASARPGMGAALTSDKLETNPTESSKEYEVSNPDSISPATYRKMSYDSTITIGTIIVQGVVSGLKYNISCADPVVQGVIDQAYKGQHTDIVRNLVRTGFQDGYCFGEKVYKRETFTVNKIGEDGESETVYSGLGIGLSKVKWIDPLANIKFYKSKKTGELVHVEQQQTGKTVTVKADKLVWFALDKQYDNIFGRSRYKAAYPYWYNSKIGNQWALRHLERTGSPILVGRHPNGSTLVQNPGGTPAPVENSVIMAQILRSVSSGSRITISSERDRDHGEFNWDVSYLEPKDADIKPFLVFEDHNERKKLEALGVFSSLVMPGSNFSDADAKLDLLVAVLEDFVNQIEVVIKEDVINYLILYNFGEEYTNQVSFNIDRGGLGRRNIIKEILGNSLRIAASQKGKYLLRWPDVEAMMRELGIPSAPYKAQFADDESIDPENENGETPLEEIERDEQSNNVEDGTRQPDNRERDRTTERDNAMETT